MDISDLTRAPLMRLAESTIVRDAIEQAPISRDVVKRFVAGTTVADAVRVTGELRVTERTATLDYLGEDTLDREQARSTVRTYVEMLDSLAREGYSQDRRAEVSVKLSAVGQALAGDGDQIALENARIICQAAREAGTTVTLDMEDHTTTDSTLSILASLRADFPETGAVLQSYLRRTEADCADLAAAGSRVRLCKGAYNEPDSVAYQSAEEVDLSYVRCLKVLMQGEGYPMVATHDPRLVDIARALANQSGREASSFEFQMLYGIRPDEQVRIADRGAHLRVYIPFGEQWYGYLVRRMAERPANLGFFLRALASKG